MVMKKMSLAFMALSLIVSCKSPELPKSEDIVSGTSELNANEVTNAKVICSSLKAKRLLFDNYADGEKSFPFRLTSQTCNSTRENIKTFSTLLRIPTSGVPYFSDPGVDFFESTVETDTLGLLEDICHEIEKGNGIKKLEDIGTYRNRHDFRNTNGKYSYQLTHYSNDKGKWIAKRISRLSFIINNSELNGMVKERVSESLCQNKKVSKITQYMKL
jgi:hypothetical protein